MLAARFRGRTTDALTQERLGKFENERRGFDAVLTALSGQAETRMSENEDKAKIQVQTRRWRPSSRTSRTHSRPQARHDQGRAYGGKCAATKCLLRDCADVGSRTTLFVGENTDDQQTLNAKELRPGGALDRMKRGADVRVIAWVLMCVSLSVPAAAEDYPARPVRIVVPSPPGGGTDIIGRVLAQYLSKTMSQQFFVENRPGAGNMIGIESVARAAPDGYTLLFAPSTLALNSVLYKKVSYDPVRDFAPITIAATTANVP